MQRSETIVWMDDVEEHLGSIRMMLDYNGHRDVRTFTDKAAGYDWVAEHSAALVGFDLLSPGMSGWQLLSLLRASPLTRNIPRICNSAIRGRERQQEVRSHVTSFLPKTTDIDTFRQAIDEALSIDPTRCVPKLHRYRSTVPFLAWSRIADIWRLMLSDLGDAVTSIEEPQPWCLDFLFRRDGKLFGGRVFRPFSIVVSLKYQVKAFADSLAGKNADGGLLFPLFPLRGDTKAARGQHRVFVFDHTLTAFLMRNTRKPHLKKVLLGKRPAL